MITIEVNTSKKYDVIVGPTTPTPAFKIGEKTSDPLTMYVNDILTIPVNLAGVPGISVPCGLSSEGLPLGLQIIGKRFCDGDVLAASHTFEQLRPWRDLYRIPFSRAL